MMENNAPSGVYHLSWKTKLKDMKLEAVGDPPVHPKGDQSWVFIRRTDAEAETPILRPPHAKS